MKTLGFVLCLSVACAHSAPPAPPAAPPAPPAALAAATPPASARWTTSMKVGRCVGLNKIDETKAAGYDYIELAVQPIAKLSDEEFAKALAEHDKAGIATPVANGFLPPDLKVTGPAVDPAQQMAYVTKAFDRMARLGVKIIV